MAWVRTDDQFWYHEKVVDLSDGACLLFLIALAHSNAHLTDGRITPTRLNICAAARRLPDANGLAAELVAAGLWEKSRGGWCIHDYARYQPTAASIKKRRTTATRRQADKREKKRAGAEGHNSPLDYVESHASSHGVTPREVTGDNSRNESRTESCVSHGVPVPNPDPFKKTPPPPPPSDDGGVSASETVVYDDDGYAALRPRERARLDDRLAYADWLRDLNARRRELEARDDALADEKAARASSP